MAKLEIIARQSAHPTGWLGQIVARVMAHDTARANRRVIERLAPKPGDRVLELGCGHGRALRRVAARTEPGLAAGVDPSTVMLSVARRHLRRAIDAGTARVDRGEAGAIPHAGEAFDKAFSVHSVYFWPDLDAGLRELRRVLRPRGELLLAFHDGSSAVLRAELPASVYRLRSAEEIARALQTAGFRDVRRETDRETGLCFARARRGDSQ